MDTEEQQVSGAESLASFPWYLSPVMILLLGFMAIALIVGTNAMNEKHRKNFTFANAILDLRASTGRAHLWLEEALQDGSEAKKAQALANHTDAMKLVLAIQYGGETKHGLVLPPLRDSAMLSQMETINQYLTELVAITQQRLIQPEDSGPGSETDDHYNRVYNKLQGVAGALEESAESRVLEDYITSKRLYLTISFLWVLTFVGATVLAGRLAVRKKQAEDFLFRVHQELETRVAKQTESLRMVNEQLRQELVARQQSEAALRESEKEAARQAHLAALGELAAGVAHEINNPVNGIINCAELMINKSRAESREHELCRRIIKEGNRIAYITRSLLSFSRQDVDDKSRIPIQTILAEVLPLIEPQLRNEGIVLELEMPDDTLPVLAHLHQLEQVFLNIINNARYALNQRYPGKHPDKKLIIAACVTMADNHPCARISFLDQGGGIPTSLLERIKDPFYSTKPKDQGSGLGLSISHGIVANHGGRLTIDSIEGEYTEVAVELPLLQEG